MSALRNRSRGRPDLTTSFASEYKMLFNHTMGKETAVELKKSYCCDSSQLDTTLTGYEDLGNTEFLLCQLILCLISNDENLEAMREKFLNMCFDKRT